MRRALYRCATTAALIKETFVQMVDHCQHVHNSILVHVSDRVGLSDRLQQDPVRQRHPGRGRGDLGVGLEPGTRRSLALVGPPRHEPSTAAGVAGKRRLWTFFDDA